MLVAYTMVTHFDSMSISTFRFMFAGRVIAYAIVQGQLLDVFFARHFYKALLKK